MITESRVSREPRAGGFVRPGRDAQIKTKLADIVQKPEYRGIDYFYKFCLPVVDILMLKDARANVHGALIEQEGETSLTISTQFKVRIGVIDSGAVGQLMEGRKYGLIVVNGINTLPLLKNMGNAIFASLRPGGYAILDFQNGEQNFVKATGIKEEITSRLRERGLSPAFCEHYNEKLNVYTVYKPTPKELGLREKRDAVFISSIAKPRDIGTKGAKGVPKSRAGLLHPF